MYTERIDKCSNRIKTALRVRRMKQCDLCEKTKIPKSSLSLYLSGAYEPRQDRLYEIAVALNVSEAWLMGYDVPMEREKPTPKERVDLTEKQRRLLDLFDLVPESQQEMLIGMIEGALKKR